MFPETKTVRILGATGMLGGMLLRELEGRCFVKSLDIPRVQPCSFSDLKSQLDSATYNTPPDFIVNCIGAIKPKFNNSSQLASNIFVNSIFPRMLADYCEAQGIKLIHITTDCVFSGKTGQYTESSTHDALDEYGKSKSLGEPTNCMTLRTSIIGPEWNGNKRSLVEWLLSQTEVGKVNGFTNHFWNGLTTLELSHCIERIVRHLYNPGIFHVFGEDVSKYTMLRTMVSAWNLPIKVESVEAKEACNRTLRTERGINQMLCVKDFDTQICELKKYI